MAMRFLQIPNQIGLAGLDFDFVDVAGSGHDHQVAFMIQTHAPPDIRNDKIPMWIKIICERDFHL